MDKTRIVIAGGGIAGVPVAYSVKAALHGAADVTVVGDGDRFHFVPANPWLALGLRDKRDVSFALQPLLASRKIRFTPHGVRTIDPNHNRLILGDESSLEYDYLVLATGIEPDWKRVPCSEPGRDVYSVIRPADAAAAYDAYRAFIKQPGPVVVAGAAGASILGPMYEYVFLLDAELRRRGLRERVPITFVTPEPYPGHLGLDKPPARDELQQALKANDIEWIGNAEVTNCHDGRFRFVVHGDTDSPAERDIRFDYAVVWPPFKGVSALVEAGIPTDEHGLVRVDEYQRAPGYTNIFALGSCTAKPARTHTPVPVGVPDAVYSVQQQAEVVSRNIVNSTRGGPLASGKIERENWIQDSGKRGAGQLSAPQMPLRNINWLRQGRWVFEAKRDFENYFLNQILFGGSQRGQVAALVRRLASQTPEHGESGAAMPGASLTVSDDGRRRLEAIGRRLGVDASRLARQLLESAIKDALSYLDPDTRRNVEAEVEANLRDELGAERERVRFEGGAP